MAVYIYVFALTIFVLWQLYVVYGFWLYVASLVMFLAFMVVPIFIARRYFMSIKGELLTRLTPEEYFFLKQHAIRSMYPFGAKHFSNVCVFLQIAGVIFGAAFLVRQYWFYGALCILDYPIFGLVKYLLKKTA